MFRLTHVFACGVAAFALGCPSAQPVSQPAEDTTPVAPPPRSDDGIMPPEQGYWERVGPGEWVCDMGAGLGADVQLTAPPPGVGFLRVVLPPGAQGAVLTEMKATYVRNAAADSADGRDPSAVGEATWRILAATGDGPGAELGRIDVTITEAQTVPFDEGGEPVTHALPRIEVSSAFWVAFNVRSGDPRVGAMYVNRPDGIQFDDLYFRPNPDAPLGAPVNSRPYLAFTFEDLGR